jgi:LPXTG-site transpeptidase (sortase) family protein
VAGTQTNTATADSDETDEVSDGAEYFGNAPAIDIEKLTNGENADVPPGPTVMIGDPVAWTYVVTNTGNVALTNVTVTDDQGVTVTCPQTTLAVAESMTCTASGTAQLGQYANIGTVTANYGATLVNDSDASHYLGTSAPLIGVAKRVVGTPVLVSPGTWDVTYEIYVSNYGNVPLTALQVTDDLVATFPPASTFTVQNVTSADFAVNWLGYNGNSNVNLLAGTDTLNVGASGTITVVVRVVPVAVGPFLNTAVASGLPPSGPRVEDDSQNGTDPDVTPSGNPLFNNNGDPTDNNEPTPVNFGPNLFDPPFGIKTLDANNLPILRWTMVWINDTNITAINARVSDPIPTGTTYVAAGLPSGYAVPGGAPAGSTNVGISCTDTSAITFTTLCYYEGPTLPTYPLGRIVWEGTLGPDFGVTNPDTAVNDIAITFHVRVDNGIRQVQNRATVDADLNGDGDMDDPGEQRLAEAEAVWSASGRLPNTGFAPGVVTQVPPQPASQAYASAGDMILEIPSLGVNTSVVGVPKQGDTWDVTWLWNQAGWLHGTAYPTWNGNSVVTAHVYLPNGQPGPFVNLSTLVWGQKIIVRANGQRSVYEVREIRQIKPADESVFKHEDKAWLTLLTCKDYDEKTNTYRARYIVRAVLVDVTRDTILQNGNR